jgi:hypothetical protein
MLDFSRTRIEKTRAAAILSSVEVAQEGLCLQMTLSGGKEYCRPSDATANSQFIGISWGERFGPPATVAKVEVVHTGSDAKATLSKEATGNTEMFVSLGTAYGTLMAHDAGTPDNTEYKLESDKKTLTFHADHADKDVFVVYRYNLTVIEAQVLIGDAFPGQRSHAFIGQAGMITGGIVYTDFFDPAINWAAVDLTTEVIVGGANGRLTTGTGCSLAGNAHVISAPTAGDPWLGLYIDR